MSQLRLINFVIDPFSKRKRFIELDALAVKKWIPRASFEAAKTDVELCSLVWILCYGAALLAMGEVAPRSLKRLGWAFIILGSVFFLIWMKFKAAFAPVLGVDYLGSASIMMIVTFGILHIGHGIGVLIRKEKN